MSRCDVIVIGAGHNGLTAATLLARAGRKVIVLERRDVAGGLASGAEFHPGYRGAGLLHDTSGVGERMVRALQLRRYGLVWLEQPPPVYVAQESGRGLLLERDPARAADEIAALWRHDNERYLEYRALMQRLAGALGRFLDDPAPDVLAPGGASLVQLLGHGLALRRLGRRDLRTLLRIAPMSLADWLGETFHSDLLAAALAGPALQGTFTAPRSPGTTASLLRQELLADGAIRRGPKALIDTLEAAAHANGAEVRTGAAVERIRLDGGQVRGVRLAGGEEIDAPVVASSCDPQTTLLGMLAPQHLTPRLARRLANLRVAGTSALVNLALSGPLVFDARPDLRVEHARTGAGLDDLERAFDPVKYGAWSGEPILSIYVPSVANTDLAPAGHAVVSILVQYVPYALRRKGGWTDEAREALGDRVVAALAAHASTVPERLVAREVLAPPDVEARYGVRGGQVHHVEHGLDQLLVRPCPECTRARTPFEGLFLCGSGSHPGGGLTCRPGAIGARAILR